VEFNPKLACLYNQDYNDEASNNVEWIIQFYIAVVFFFASFSHQLSLQKLKLSPLIMEPNISYLSGIADSGIIVASEQEIIRNEANLRSDSPNKRTVRKSRDSQFGGID
jgi:hypothetical protein